MRHSSRNRGDMAITTALSDGRAVFRPGRPSTKRTVKFWIAVDNAAYRRHSDV
jgi:hypothetical protein